MTINGNKSVYFIDSLIHIGKSDILIQIQISLTIIELKSNMRTPDTSSSFLLLVNNGFHLLGLYLFLWLCKPIQFKCFRNVCMYILHAILNGRKSVLSICRSKQFVFPIFTMLVLMNVFSNLHCSELQNIDKIPLQITTFMI